MSRMHALQREGFFSQGLKPSAPRTSPPGPLNGAPHSLQWGELGRWMKNRRSGSKCSFGSVRTMRHHSSLPGAGFSGSATRSL